MSWNRRSAVVLTAVAFSAAGCGLGQPGTTPPDPSAGPASQAVPVRPHELSLAAKTGEDLCSLLAPEQQAQLGVARPTPGPGEDPETLGECTWLSAPGAEQSVGINVYARQMNLADFKEEVGDPFPETAASYELAGYRAEQIQAGDGLEGSGCSVGVDVAEGQTLEAFLSPQPLGSMTNQDMCAKAKQAAEFAVTNLQAQG